MCIEQYLQRLIADPMRSKSKTNIGNEAVNVELRELLSEIKKHAGEASDFAWVGKKID
jgi:hypothetical protein